MNPNDQVASLEQAIFERAKNLADEHLRQAQRARERILADSAERLRLLEEKEMSLAKSRAEREFRRLVQSAEIHMQADMDRMRWGLVQSVMQGVNGRLKTLQANDESGLALLRALLVEAASAIERDELVARVSVFDHGRVQGRWDLEFRNAVPGKTIGLSPDACPCSGGVLVESVDGRISVDNTFEGRMSRQKSDLERVILERLFASAGQMGMLFHG
ncbi:MAG: V-type ATP synthase subunit E [Gammaproteobacteria bacterium]|nr:V-type ATP synthase subunit E [Gammaproteobacteria bacterium]